MNTFKYMVVLISFCFMYCFGSDIVLINLCGQEIKVIYDQFKEGILDGQAFALKGVAVNGDTISVAPVSRFRSHEERQYAVISLKNKSLFVDVKKDYIILIDSFSEQDFSIVKYRVQSFAQGSKLFQNIVRSIERINVVIKPQVKNIFEKVRKGVVAKKKEGKLIGFRLRGINRKDLNRYIKTLEKNKKDVWSCKKQLMDVVPMHDQQKKDFSDAFYSDLHSNTEKLLEKLTKVQAELS